MTTGNTTLSSTDSAPDNTHPVDSVTRTCCGGVGRHTRDCPQFGAADMACRLVGLTEAVENLASVAADQLDGARRTRAVELVDMLRAAIDHAQRLAVIIEDDRRAEAR